MSRKNKVNKTNYDQGGRLTPDDMARERKQQRQLRPPAFGKGTARQGERVKGKAGGPGASRPRSAPEE